MGGERLSIQEFGAWEQIVMVASTAKRHPSSGAITLFSIDEFEASTGVAKGESNHRWGREVG